MDWKKNFNSTSSSNGGASRNTTCGAVRKAAHSANRDGNGSSGGSGAAPPPLHAEGWSQRHRGSGCNGSRCIGNDNRACMRSAVSAQDCGVAFVATNNVGRTGGGGGAGAAADVGRAPGEQESDGTRRSWEAPLGRGRDRMAWQVARMMPAMSRSSTNWVVTLSGRQRWWRVWR